MDNYTLLSSAHWNDLYLQRALDVITDVRHDYIVMQGEVVTRGSEEHLFILEDGRAVSSGAVSEAIAPIVPADEPAPILSNARNVAYSLRETLADEFILPVSTVDQALDVIADLVINGDGVTGGGGVGEDVEAADVSFDPVGTSLESENVQDALVELENTVMSGDHSECESAVGATSVLLSTNIRVPGRGSQPGRPDAMGQSAGWYFRNNRADDFISWRMIGNVKGNVMRLSNLTGCYAVIDMRGLEIPSFEVRTKPKGDGLDDSENYRSRIVYTPWEEDLSYYSGETMLLVCGDDPGFFPGYRRLYYRPTTASGPQEGNENVEFVSMDTSTLMDAFSYEFVITQYGYTFGGTTDSYVLSSPSGYAASIGDLAEGVA